MSQVELLGVRDAAELAGVSTATIKRAALTGKLVGKKLGDNTSAYVFTREAVEAFRQERAA